MLRQRTLRAAVDAKMGNAIGTQSAGAALGTPALGPSPPGHDLRLCTAPEKPRFRAFVGFAEQSFPPLALYATGVVADSETWATGYGGRQQGALTNTALYGRSCRTRSFSFSHTDSCRAAGNRNFMNVSRERLVIVLRVATVTRNPSRPRGPMDRSVTRMSCCKGAADAQPAVA